MVRTPPESAPESAPDPGSAPGSDPGSAPGSDPGSAPGSDPGSPSGSARDPDPVAREARALRVSGATAGVLAGVGVAWGLWASSMVILFDGLFALVGVALSWLGLRIAALVERGPTPSYPFGREALAPLMVAVQALVLVATFGYAVLDAIRVILDGGSAANVGSALLYSVLTLVVCVGVHRLLAGWAGDSDLVAAEVMQWRASVVLGVAMTVGFAGALALERSAWAGAAPYVDPLLVLLAACLVLPEPLRMLRGAFRELLEGRPDVSITDPVDAAVAKVRDEFGLPEPDLRIGKLGRKVYLELDFLVAADGPWTVGHADLVRRRLMEELARPGRLLWINVEIHTDPSWDAAPQ